MFYVYNISTKKVEKVDTINSEIHRHRNSKEEFTFIEKKVKSKEEIKEEIVETPVKKT